MEEYLIKDYDVLEDERYLPSIESIVPYFKSLDSRGYFDCGEGYYQDEHEQLIKIKDKFYRVTITAEIGSQWMDVGDRVYFVESIKNVEYIEIDKPTPKKKVTTIIKVVCTRENLDSLEEFVRERAIYYEIY